MQIRLFIGLLGFSFLAATFFAKTEPAAQALPTQGRVIDAITLEPIQGATVQVQASALVTTTNVRGEFTLDIPDGPFFILAAAKKGYVNNGSYEGVAGATDVVIPLSPLPIESDPETFPFLSPMGCASCHTTHFADWYGGGEVRPSRHATAGQNRWVRDLYDGSGTEGGSAGYIFKRDSPIFDDTINPAGLHHSGLCAECHLPSLAALAEIPGTVELSDATAGSAEGTPERMAYDNGIFCGICHKIEKVNDNLGRTAFFGNIEPRLTDPGILFGPLADAVIDIPGQMRASYNPLLGESRVCAGCHQYNMDHDFDNDFDEEGSPPGQSTFEEWLSSPYAQPGEHHRSCQDCHMPPHEGGIDGPICVFGGPVRSATALHSHRFEGTTLSFLRSAVELVLHASREGDVLRARVEVSNVGAGHNFPTGVSVRNAMLVVRARTPLGEELPHLEGTSLIPEWGGVGDDPNDYGNTPGRGYAKILRSHDNRERVLFVDAVELVSNTQIPPMGVDVSEYLFDLSGFEGEDIEISARIVYRRAWKDLAETKGWIGGVDGQGFPYEGDIEVKSVAVELEGGNATPSPNPGEDCDRGFYLLDAYGGRHAVGMPPIITGGLYFGRDMARDLETVRLEVAKSQEWDLVVLDGAGVVHFVEHPDKAIPQTFYFGEELTAFPQGRAMDLEISADGRGLWVLTDYGGIYRAGSSLPENEEALVPNTENLGLGWDVPIGADLRAEGFAVPGGATLRAVALVVIDEDKDSFADGYLILDSMGGHYQLDDQGRFLTPGDSMGAPDDSPRRLLDPGAYVWPFFPGLDIARDMELHPTEQGVVLLDGWGGIHPVPVDRPSNPVFFANNRQPENPTEPISTVGMPYLTTGFPQKNGKGEEALERDAGSIFADLEFSTGCGRGFYTLDRFGGIFAFGDARSSADDPLPPFQGTPYFFPEPLAQDVEFFE